MLLLHKCQEACSFVAEHSYEVRVGLIVIIWLSVFYLLGYASVATSQKVAGGLVQLCEPRALDVACERIYLPQGEDALRNHVTALLADAAPSSWQPATLLTSLQKQYPFIAGIRWCVHNRERATLSVIGVVPRFVVNNGARVLVQNGRLLEPDYFSVAALESLPHITLPASMLTMANVEEQFFAFLEQVPAHIWRTYRMQYMSPDRIQLQAKDDEHGWDVLANQELLVDESMYKRLAAVQQDLIAHQRLAGTQRVTFDVRFADRIVVQPHAANS